MLDLEFMGRIFNLLIGDNMLKGGDVFQIIIDNIAKAESLLDDLYLTNKNDRLKIARFRMQLSNINRTLHEMEERY